MLLDGLKGGVDQRFLEVLKSHDAVTCYAISWASVEEVRALPVLVFCTIIRRGEE